MPEGSAQERGFFAPVSATWTDEEWKKATDDKDYSGKKEKEEEQRTAPDRENSNWLNEIFTSPLAKALSIIVIFSVLVFTMLKLLGTKSKNDDRKLKGDMSFSLDLLNDKLDETDLERFLRMALEANDFKSAVRILYLSLIQQLHRKKWIVWKKDKTNHDFLNEMRHRESYSGFRDLTLAFEIVWYGDAPVSREEFGLLKIRFTAYQSLIDQSGGQ